MFMTLLVLATGYAAAAAKFDSPDLAREAQMHHDFERPEGAPPTLAPDAYVENYRIQRGDTLWSLSHLLYGDGSYWPRVWAQNHAVTNPHLVREGHQLEVLLGSEDDAPAFRFSEDAGPAGRPVSLTAASAGPSVEIPPPETSPRPVLRIPKSFPEWQSVYRRNPVSVLDDRSLARRFVPPISHVLLRGWVEDTEPVPVGQMLENDSEAGLPVVNQYVYVKVKRAEATANKMMLVVQPVLPLKRVSEHYQDEREGFLLQTAAEIQLTERAQNTFTSSRDREESETWRALIVKTTGLSTKGADLINGTLKTVDVSPRGPAGRGTAQIMGSDRNASSVLYGAGDFVFLDRGSADGFANGELYDVFSDRRSRHEGTPVPYSPAPTGRLKIIRVTEHLATAFVLEAPGSILQGDRVRQISGRGNISERAESIQIAPNRPGNKQIKSDGSAEDAELERAINQTF